MERNIAGWGEKKIGIENNLKLQDYDDFDVANEDDELEEFLGIPRKTPKVKNNSHLFLLAIKEQIIAYSLVELRLAYL